MLIEGLWCVKGSDLHYIIKERNDGNFEAYCSISGNTHLIEKNKCNNFLQNHEFKGE